MKKLAKLYTDVKNVTALFFNAPGSFKKLCGRQLSWLAAKAAPSLPANSPKFVSPTFLLVSARKKSTQGKPLRLYGFCNNRE
jgi:hypothetical protein